VKKEKTLGPASMPKHENQPPLELNKMAADGYRKSAVEKFGLTPGLASNTRRMKT
jgi:hypothetical protein